MKMQPYSCDILELAAGVDEKGTVVWQQWRRVVSAEVVRAACWT